MLGIDKANHLDNAYRLGLVDMKRFQEDILLHYFIKQPLD
jgi:hypothetical protein